MALGDNIQNVGFSIWSATATLPSAAVVGNSILVISNANDAALTCSDDLNGAYTKIATFGSGPRLSFFLVTNTSAASAPVITLSTGGRRSFALEVEGDLTPAAGSGTFTIPSTPTGPNSFTTSANDIPASSVSIGAWGCDRDGSGITPDSPWVGVSVDNQTYPFCIRQDTSAVAGGVFSGTYDGFGGDQVVGLFVSLTEVGVGLTIDSTDASMQRNTNFQVVCSGPTTAPTTGNTTLTNGNDTLTPTSVTGSDPYTLTFPVGDLSKQVDATGYDWTLTVDLETATTGNIPLVIQAGYTLVDLVDPVTTNASLLFGVTGDTPVTGDHLEYDITSTLDSGVTLSVAASGVWTITEAVDGDWVTDITVSRRVVQADGTIGTEAVVTLSAPTSATSGLTIVTDMVSNIVSNMVN